jgi:inhibitor of KinA sporulation pathway (predicted exonuclease)
MKNEPLFHLLDGSPVHRDDELYVAHEYVFRAGARCRAEFKADGDFVTVRSVPSGAVPSVPLSALSRTPHLPQRAVAAEAPPADFTLTPTSELLEALKPLSAANPELHEYLRRQQNQALHERDIVRLMLQVAALPVLAVVDMEATFYATADETQKYGKEIIEVGWSLLEPATGKVLQTRQRFIKPTKGFVSEKCTRLTGITNEQLASAPSFSQAMAEMHELHRARNVQVWAAFGPYDTEMIGNQCVAEGVLNPWVDQRFFNIRELAGVYFGFGKHLPGLAKCLARAGLEFEGPQHSGLADAVNTARLLSHMLGR